MSILSNLFGRKKTEEVAKTEETEVKMSNIEMMHGGYEPMSAGNAASYIKLMALKAVLFSTIPSDNDTQNINLVSLQEKCKQGDGEAQFLMGRLYSAGKLVEKDDKKAYQYFKLSAENGNMKGLNALGTCYLQGTQVEQNYDKALELFNRAYQAGYANAGSNIATTYLLLGGDDNKEKAFQQFLKQAEANQLPDIFTLICDFSTHDEAFGEWCVDYLYNYALRSKNCNLMNLAAEVLDAGAIGGHQENGAAAYLCIVSAALGNEEAQQTICKIEKERVAQVECEIGIRRLIDGDTAIAQTLFNSSSAKGYADAYCYLGYMHEEGMGIPQDNYKAAEYFKAAHQRGSVNGTCSMAIFYANGKGGLPKNMTKAFELFKQAAEQNNGLAQYNLAMFFLNGYGVVTPNPSKAYELLTASASQGCEEAKEYLKRL